MTPTAGDDDAPRPAVRVRPMRARDVPDLVQLSALSYPPLLGWREEELESHLRVFPQGQLVAEDAGSGDILGMAASLVLARDDFPPNADWYQLTGDGFFTTHDPEGETLYGAGVLVGEDARGRGVGTALYEGREELLRSLGLARIVAGARISGYHEVAGEMSAWEYVDQVVRGERTDPALSFQLARGFRVLRVIPDYLPEDRESLGFAAEIEWRPA